MKDFTRRDWGLLTLRLAVGGLMLFHGLAKLHHGVDGIAGRLEAKGLPSALAYGAYAGEVLAPLLLLAGVLTVPAALIVAFNMLMAVYVAHSGDVFALSPHGGWAIELPMFYFLGALAVALAGPGRIALRVGGPGRR